MTVLSLLMANANADLARADMAAAQAALDAGDYLAAAHELRPLVDAGDPQAQYQLAKLVLEGRMVGLKPEQAMSLLVQSAAQGNGHAQARLGLAYARGDHVAQNNLAAFQWLSRAGVSPDLSDTERTVVAANRRAMLDRLSPTLATGTSVEDAAALAMSPTPEPPPAPPSTSPAPVSSIEDVPYFSSKPLTGPQDTDGTKAAASQPAAATVVHADSIATVPYFSSTPLATPQATEATMEPAAQPAPVGLQATSRVTSPAASSAARPSHGDVFIQLASLPTESAAQAEEDRLRQKFPTVLNDLTLTHQIVNLKDKGTYHRILAGPFDNRADAKSRCVRFRAAKQSCIVTIAPD